MPKIIVSFLILFEFCFLGNTSAQNLTFDINALCANSTSCNPFVNTYLCQSAAIRATHGSPTFYTTTASPAVRKIELLSQYNPNGVNYTEGFTLEYPFKPNINYTVKITHSVKPGTTSASTYLIASLTDSPPRYDDGCGLGYLISTSEYYAEQFIVSTTEKTTSFDYKPSTFIPYLWLRSNTYSISTDLEGLVISKIEIVDHSAPQPPPPPPPIPTGNYTSCNDYTDTHYYCEQHYQPVGSVDSWGITTDGEIILHCQVFIPGSHNFNAIGEVITMNPGFLASSDNGKKYQAIAEYVHCGSSNYSNKLVKGQITLDTLGNIVQDQTAEESKILQIYPSPSTGIINIKGAGVENSGEGRIIVSDPLGRTVYNKTYNSLQDGTSINLSSFSNGVYYISIYTATNIVTKKIIIAK